MGNSRFEGYPRNRILYVVDDDEIAFYAGVFDLPSQVDEFLSLFLKHQKNFSLFLASLFLIEVLLGVFAYFDKERAVLQVYLINWFNVNMNSWWEHIKILLTMYLKRYILVL